MTAGQRLSREQIARVRVEHSLVDVLARLGIAPPQRWDGASDYMISCPCPDHNDSTPSCIIHPHTDRWNCFGCGAHGDILELVRRVEDITSLHAIAETLDSRRPLVPATRDGVITTQRDSSTVIRASERPDLSRTSYERVMGANTAAWRYLSLPRLARRGRDYLRARGIDVTALETETGRPVVGHTPYQADGLVTHLRRRGFTDDEIVDAGWGVRRDGQLSDRFRRRVLIPVRDEQAQVVGVYGRDVTRSAKQKYLNTADTVAFGKGAAIYRPNVSQLDQHATVIVCEGSLDALAIAARAATAGTSPYFAPVSPSGTALTDTQARMILAISNRPTLVCADGDDAGLAASEKWIRTFMAHGRETIVTILPEDHDPASWLNEHGTDGLRAFARKGCLDLPAETVKPTPAGGLLAERILAEEITAARRLDPDTETALVMPAVLDRLANEAIKVPGEAARQRFASSAGDALARLVDGMNAGGRTRQVQAATQRITSVGGVGPECEVDRCVTR